MKNVNLIGRLCVGLIALILFGSATAQNLQARPVFTDVTTTISSLDSKFLRVGTHVPTSRILNVQRGLSEAQVSQQLGQPVVVSNANGANAWEYHFSLPMADGRDNLICQFIVQFDSATRLVDFTQWRRRQCQALAGSVVHLSADVLFGFDQHQLSATGRAEVDRLLSSFHTQGVPLSATVFGYSDRLGETAYNQRLSDLRARSVAEYLINRGVPKAALRAQGRGASDPLVICEGNAPTAALKACLSPNRRISIQIDAAAT